MEPRSTPDETPSPYLPPRPSGDPGPQDRQEDHHDDGPAPRRRVAGWVVVAAVAALVLLGALLVPWLQSSSRTAPTPEASVSRNPSPGVDGIVARAVPAAQQVPGDCLTDFEDIESASTVVECEKAHQAQLIARKTWPESASFPEGGMRGPAEEFCGQVPLTGSPQAQVRIEISHPNQATWEEGDRRVDCVAHALQGTLTASLVETPVVEPSPTPSASAAPTPSASPSPSDG